MCQWVKVLAQEIWGYELGFHHSGKKLGMAEQSCILSIGWQKQADSMRSKNSQSFWLKRQATGPVRDLTAIRWHDIKGDNQCLALAFCIHVHILLCMNPPLSHTHTKRGFYISLLDILAKTFIFRITWLLIHSKRSSIYNETSHFPLLWSSCVLIISSKESMCACFILPQLVLHTQAQYLQHNHCAISVSRNRS